ncbi:MAG: hypothetical protein NC092_03360 [Butyrivibrio sp.]|nr:hypothetical protein [Muribaculum sp.]MCM1551712.1 hypothetical protein [Butyrivibrio sp.]
MNYVVRNEQDLDALMEERMQGIKAQDDWEWEGQRWYACDAIILNAKGKWFDRNIVSRLNIWEGSIVNYQPVRKIRPEDREKIKNTIRYIRDNFDHIYQVMLETLLPTIIEWGVPDCKTGEPITTIQQIHDNHGSQIKAEMESWCITNIQLNCGYQKDDMVYYSFLYRLNPFDDGLEVVFWKDRVVFFVDGNPEDAIFEFDKGYKDYPMHFEID